MKAKYICFASGVVFLTCFMGMKWYLHRNDNVDQNKQLELVKKLTFESSILSKSSTVSTEPENDMLDITHIVHQVVTEDHEVESYNQESEDFSVGDNVMQMSDYFPEPVYVDDEVFFQDETIDIDVFNLSN